MTEPDYYEDPQTALEWAITYAQHGLRVIPVAPGAKHPANIGRWQDAATRDPDIIRSWWTGLYRGHGVGIATGADSGVWVLDVDVAGGKVGDESLADLEAAYGPLPDTHEHITGTGGRHLFFAWDPARPIRNNQSGKLGVDLDVRGDGGQVLAPPTIHPNGTPYTVELGSPLWTFAHAPDWVYAVLLHQPEPQAPRAHQGHLLPSTNLDAGDRPGDLWAQATEWAEILTRDGWTLGHVDRTGEQHWVRPGKHKREGTSATVDYKGGDTLKVFTSSMRHLGLDPDATYTKLGYLAAVHHGGDHSAAARALREQGWRKPEPTVTLAPRPQPANPAADPVDLDDPWPEPPPMPAGPPPPPWDPTVLPGWAQAQVDNIATQVHCAPDLPGMFIVGALSTIALGHIVVEARIGHTEHPTVFLVVPAPPSEGKSAALQFVMRPVIDFEEEQVDAALDRVAEDERDRKVLERRIKSCEESAANTGDPDKAQEALEARQKLAAMAAPPKGYMMTSDVTPERVATLLAENNERIAIVSDESGVLNIDRYGDKARGSNLDVYLQAWSGRRVVVDRQRAPSVRLKRPLLTIIVGAQPEAWANALGDDEFRSRGLGARFMSATPEPRGHQRNIDLDRNQWDLDVDEEYRRRIGDLARHMASWQLPATIRLTRDAKRTWTTWGQPLQTRMGPAGDLAHEAGWVSKMRDTVIRVAALLHLADGHGHDIEVDGDTMARATRLGDYWIGHRLHETSDEYDQARRLLDALARITQRDGLTVIDRRTIGRKGPKGMRKVDEMAEPLGLLAQAGWVRIHGSFAPGSRLDDLQIARAMDGVEVHPAALRNPDGNPEPERGDTGRQGRQIAPSEVDGHSESTSVAPVAPVAYIGESDPQPPQNRPSDAPPQNRGDRGDNVTADTIDGLDPTGLFGPPDQET